MCARIHYLRQVCSPVCDDRGQYVMYVQGNLTTSETLRSDIRKVQALKRFKTKIQLQSGEALIPESPHNSTGRTCRDQIFSHKGAISRYGSNLTIHSQHPHAMHSVCLTVRQQIFPLYLQRHPLYLQRQHPIILTPALRTNRKAGSTENATTSLQQVCAASIVSIGT